jgi:hypothetical protein
VPEKSRPLPWTDAIPELFMGLKPVWPGDAAALLGVMEGIFAVGRVEDRAGRHVLYVIGVRTSMAYERA